MGFASFLLGQDTLGHAFSFSYKGNKTYETPLGAFISITIKILVLINCVQHLISLIEMKDPKI